jgi:hypothetical protein
VAPGGQRLPLIMRTAIPGAPAHATCPALRLTTGRKASGNDRPGNDRSRTSPAGNTRALLRWPIWDGSIRASVRRCFLIDCLIGSLGLVAIRWLVQGWGPPSGFPATSSATPVSSEVAGEIVRSLVGHHPVIWDSVNTHGSPPIPEAAAPQIGQMPGSCLLGQWLLCGCLRLAFP